MVVGAANAWVGYALKYQRRYGLIAGYDAARDAEPAALARWIGTGGFALASICATGIIGVLAFPDGLVPVLRTVGGAVAVVVLVIASGAIGRKS